MRLMAKFLDAAMICDRCTTGGSPCRRCVAHPMRAVVRASWGCRGAFVSGLSLSHQKDPRIGRARHDDAGGSGTVRVGRRPCAQR